MERQRVTDRQSDEETEIYGDERLRDRDSERHNN